MQLKDIAHKRGLAGPLAFAIDGQNKPGHVIVHCIRFETFHMTEELFSKTKFHMLHADSDRRILVLATCFLKGQQGE